MAAVSSKDGALLPLGQGLDPLYTQEIIMKVSEIIEEAEQTGARVSAWDKIMMLLLEHNLAWRLQVQPEFVGVHPSNRSKFGVGGAECQSHGLEVLTAGFSWRKASDATAIEATPSDAEEQDFNMRLTALSGGLIPDLVLMKLLCRRVAHKRVFACHQG